MGEVVTWSCDLFSLSENAAFCLAEGGKGIFLQVIRGKNTTTALDGKQTKVKMHLAKYRETRFLTNNLCLSNN